MSVGSRELHPIQIQPLFVTGYLSSSTPASRVPPAISSRRGVKRKLFDSGNGDYINELLRNDSEKNVAHLLNKYNFDARAVSAKEAIKDSRVPGEEETKPPFPNLIAYELWSHQKRLEEASQNDSKINSTEITPPQDPNRRGKCNGPIMNNIGRFEINSEQALLKEFVNKTPQFTENKLEEVSQSPTSVEVSVVSSFAKFPSPPKVCDRTETPR